MLRVYHLLIGGVLLIIVPVGARFVLPQFSEDKTTTPTPNVTSTSTTQTKPKVKSENIWQKILGDTSVPDGWQVAPCQENGALLCVSAQGQRLGTVEIQTYPVSNNPEFQKHLQESGIPFGSPVNYQNQEDRVKVIRALQGWVADFYTNLTKNPPGADSGKVIVSTYPPQQVTIGKLPGIRYGFVALKTDGGVQQQHIGHVTYDGTKLYVITTSFAPGAGGGKFAKLENLAVFQPYLYAIAQNLNLPVQSSDKQP
jgi:hypothetical protein